MVWGVLLRICQQKNICMIAWKSSFVFLSSSLLLMLNTTSMKLVRKMLTRTKNFQTIKMRVKK